MRLIDADELKNDLENILDMEPGTFIDSKTVASLLKNIVDEQPTIAPPPNDPLTLDELAEMDGEPVWVRCAAVCGKIAEFWAIVHNNRVTGWKPADTAKQNFRLDERGGYGIGWLAYRRKPEGTA